LLWELFDYRRNRTSYFARKEFQAQVPEWVPLDKDDTVVYSGVAEIALGTAMIATPKKYRKNMGRIVADFSRLFFPGILLNIKTEGILLG
jgi:uncharacterized membrane protein